MEVRTRPKLFKKLIAESGIRSATAIGRYRPAGITAKQLIWDKDMVSWKALSFIRNRNNKSMSQRRASHPHANLLGADDDLALLHFLPAGARFVLVEELEHPSS